MASFLRRIFTVGQPELSPIRYPTSGFELLSAAAKIEEKRFEDGKSKRYYPVRLGECLATKYQVLGKLGFGSTSTVWHARDMQTHNHVALKIFARDHDNNDEFNMYQYLSTCPKAHPGSQLIRTALDTFTISANGGRHRCIVQKPLWESYRELLLRNPKRRFSEDLLKQGLRRALLALDYLHTVCHVVHTEDVDIKADNIILDIADAKLFDDYVANELEYPTPRKFVDGNPIYMSRRFGLPREFGQPILSDFGSAVRGDIEHDEDVQPNIYRAPEVMLEVPWSYPIDIWNLGCMIWDLFEGKHLFHGIDDKIPAESNPNDGGYTTRAHLAEVVGLLGLPPADLLSRGSRSKEFFTRDGQWCADFDIPHDTSLEASEEKFNDEDKAEFLRLVRSMLRWMPEDRKTAKDLLDDAWLNSDSV
ncbi:hypothetical protein LTR09_010461 [Extremus antarcticus]|uniref:Protein kinase domain-containing protein n=1 Tax=Extremus antarcticus TaxID=702011 RepID=A0AAJ0G8K1_9PEZI|nr:hypothetical protein LTR09_010461 [Extremus antarcticus]